MKPLFPCLVLLAHFLLPAAAAPDPETLKKAALQIDRHVATFYRNQKLPVPSVTDDATFLRRTFLVTIGRIPTAEEARAFLEIGETDKREMLVTYLLNSPGYSSHMSNWAFDLLRLSDSPTGSQQNNAPYRHWVRTAMQNNMPWDEFVRRLLDSSGDGWNQETAAVGYYTRDRGMPLDNISNGMRIFLGKRMECAQCHDDPFGDTERMDFYQLAAFTNGQSHVNRQHMAPLWNELRDTERARSQDYRVAQVLWDGIYGMSLGGGGKGTINLPSDYQYRDGKPGEIVAARTPFGKTVRMSDRRDANNGREQLAEWVTQRTGEQFPAVIANRMWRRVMGRGITEPVDDFIPLAKTHHPDLFRYLAGLMVELEYDLKAFQQVLLLTRTYQFSTNPKSSLVDGGDDFHGRKIERLSSEQIWDSLITLAKGDPDKTPPRPLDDRIFVAGKPVLVGRKSMADLSKEVLALDSEKEVRTYFNQLLKDIQSGGSGSAGGGDSMMMKAVANYSRDAAVRASELPSPAPRDHFLYLFGQSDREVVDAYSREPNVGQVLSLMNGFVQRQLVNNPAAHLYKSLEDASSNAEKVRRLCIAILSRPPADDEMKWMLEELDTRGEDGVRNLVSALVMSSEFLFLQ